MILIANDILVSKMKKQSNDWDDIKINKRRTDKVFFESTLIQQVSDGIDFLRNESREILTEIDNRGVNDFDLEQFSQKTLREIDNIVDDMAELKSEIIDEDDIPEFVKDTSKNAKVALNRDHDYVRRAKRRLDRIESNEVGFGKTNLRVIELCDKAIAVNESNLDAYCLKAQALINIKKYDDAIDELIKSLTIKDDFWDSWLLIGEANRLNLDFEDAISVYNKVLSENENSFEALKGKAMVYFDLGEYQNADEFFKKARLIKELDDETLKIHEECLKNLE